MVRPSPACKDIIVHLFEDKCNPIELHMDFISSIYFNYAQTSTVMFTLSVDSAEPESQLTNFFELFVLTRHRPQFP